MGGILTRHLLAKKPESVTKTVSISTSGKAKKIPTHRCYLSGINKEVVYVKNLTQGLRKEWTYEELDTDSADLSLLALQKSGLSLCLNHTNGRKASEMAHEKLSYLSEEMELPSHAVSTVPASCGAKMGGLLTADGKMPVALISLL